MTANESSNPFADIPRDATDLNFSHKTELTSLEGIGELVNLTGLNLSGCSALKSLAGLERLVNLTSLNLSGCTALKSIQPLESLPTLQHLNLSECSGLSSVDAVGELVNLTSLNLSRCSALKSLAGLEGLVNLTSLNLLGCSALKSLAGLEGLVNLTSLNLAYCSALESIQPLESLPTLQQLDLSGCSGLSSVDAVSELTSLTDLELPDGPWMEDLGTLLQSLHLTKLSLYNCTSLRSLKWVTTLKQLTSLNLTCCTSLTSLSELDGNKRLESIDITGCTGLKEVSLHDLHSLRWIGLFDDDEWMDSIDTIRIINCTSITGLDCLWACRALRHLEIVDCGSFERLSLLGLRDLETLRIINCDSLQHIHGLTEDSVIDRTQFQGEKVADSSQFALTKIERIELTGCSSLKELITTIDFWHGMAHLSHLDVSGCTDLKTLNLHNAGSLKSATGILDSKRLSHLFINGCTSLSTIDGQAFSYAEMGGFCERNWYDLGHFLDRLEVESFFKWLTTASLACSCCGSQELEGSYYALYGRAQWGRERQHAEIPLEDGGLEELISAAWTGVLSELNDDYDTPEWDIEFEQLTDVELQLTCSDCGHKQQIDASPLGSVCTGDERGSERAAQIRAPWQSSLSFPGDAPAPGSDDHASAATLACPCCEAPVLLVGESVLRQEEAGKQYGSVDLSEASGATAAEKLASGLTPEGGHTNSEGDLELIIPAKFGFRVGMRCSQFSCWSAEGIKTAQDASALLLAVAALAQVAYGPRNPDELRRRLQRAGITEEQDPATIDSAIKWLDCASELSAEAGAPVPLTQERQGSAQGLLRQLAPQ